MRQRSRRVASADAATAILRASYPNFSEAAIEHALRFNSRPVAGGELEWRFDPAFVAEGLTHALDGRGRAGFVAVPGEEGVSAGGVDDPVAAGYLEVVVGEVEFKIELPNILQLAP